VVRLEDGRGEEGGLTVLLLLAEEEEDYGEDDGESLRGEQEARTEAAERVRPARFKGRKEGRPRRREGKGLTATPPITPPAIAPLVGVPELGAPTTALALAYLLPLFVPPAVT
jgi:hypothetical protein